MGGGEGGGKLNAFPYCKVSDEAFLFLRLFFNNMYVCVYVGGGEGIFYAPLNPLTISLALAYSSQVNN